MSVLGLANYCSNPYVWGYNLSWVSTTSISVGAGVARANNSGFAIENNDALTISTSNIGVANGFVQAIGNLTTPTAMSVLVLGDSSGANSPCALVVNGAAWEQLIQDLGYDSYRRIGIAFLNASEQFIQFAQAGKSNERIYNLAESPLILSAQNQTSETAVDMGIGVDYLPAKIDTALVQVLYTPNSAANILSIVPANLTGTVEPIRVKASGAAQVIQNVEVVVNELFNVAEFDYKVGNSSDSATMYLAGVRESLDLYIES